MSLGKQAKVLSRGQIEAVLGYIAKTRYPLRNRVIFLLSVRAGLRACEIDRLTWAMLTDAQSNLAKTIHFQDRASKGRSGRPIPINTELRDALLDWLRTVGTERRMSVISTERSEQISPQATVNLFGRWYHKLGFNGCSSHSVRRTFITNTARKISGVGGSLRDVQLLAGHTNLRVTQSYIDEDQEAKRRIVDLI